MLGRGCPRRRWILLIGSHDCKGSGEGIELKSQLRRNSQLKQSLKEEDEMI